MRDDTRHAVTIVTIIQQVLPAPLAKLSHTKNNLIFLDILSHNSIFAINDKDEEVKHWKY